MQQTDCMGHRPAGGHCWPRGPEAGGSPVLDIGRREFIRLLGGAAAAWPLAARAQQTGKIPRIGIIDDAPRWKAFRHGLRDLGYLEGQNIAFDYAYGDGYRFGWRRAHVGAFALLGFIDDRLDVAHGNFRTRVGRTIASNTL